MTTDIENYDFDLIIIAAGDDDLFFIHDSGRNETQTKNNNKNLPKNAVLLVNKTNSA